MAADIFYEPSKGIFDSFLVMNEAVENAQVAESYRYSCSSTNVLPLICFSYGILTQSKGETNGRIWEVNFDY